MATENQQAIINDVVEVKTGVFSFMSGGGTCSPILDFKFLYSLLGDKYQIAVVEKSGYGFSDVVDKSRDIDYILEDTRAALTAAGLTVPYILCPHYVHDYEYKK